MRWAASLLRSASLRASSPRTRTRSRSPAPLPKRAPRAPRRSSSVASGLRGSVALAESGTGHGLGHQVFAHQSPPPQLRLSRVARALHAASTESQPPAVASWVLRSHRSCPRPLVSRSLRPTLTTNGTRSLTHTVSLAPRLPLPSRLPPLELVGVLATRASPTTAQGFQALHVEGHLVRSHCRFVHLLAVVCSRWWACSGSVHAFVGLVILPALAFSPVALGRLWHCATALAWFLVQLPVRFPCALCGVLRGLLGSSGAHFPGWLGGPLTWRSAHTVAGPAAPDLTLLLIGAVTAGGVMTKLIVRNITVLGAENSGVHAKLPFLLESFLADVLCCPCSQFVLGLSSARLHEAPCSWQLLFCIFLQSTHWMCLNPRNSSVEKKCTEVI